LPDFDQNLVLYANSMTHGGASKQQKAPPPS